MSSVKELLLPVSNRTESFWLTERDHELKNARTTSHLPPTADVVVIGSGLTGAMTAYHLYKQARMDGRRINVVILEADEVCGSATARNGEASVFCRISN
jgi:myosin-crossreactive antigen